MSKKVYRLVNGVLDGVATIASAIVVYKAPANAVAIVAAIGIVKAAVDQVCQLFVKDDEPAKVEA